MFRKAPLWILIFALLFNAFGTYLVFETARMSVRDEIKSRIKAGIPENELVRHRFRTRDIENGTAGISWKESSEFMLNGSMFDVVRRFTDGDYTIFECINDTQEEALFARLDDMMKDQPAGHKSLPLKARNLVKLLIQEAVVNEPYQWPDLTEFKEFNIKIKLFTLQFVPEVVTPPPDDRG